MCEGGGAVVGDECVRVGGGGGGAVVRDECGQWSGTNVKGGKTPLSFRHMF